MRFATLAVVVCALFVPAAASATVAVPDGQSSAAAARTPPPNIVMVYLDDTSPHDGRLWNNPAITPNIHELFIEHGARFENAVSETALCCPGRAGLLTGLHTHNHGVKVNDVRLFNPGEHIGERLKAAGYETSLIGKYFNHPNYLTPAQWAASAAGWTNLDVFRTTPKEDLAYYFDYTLFTKEGDVAYPTTHSTRMIAERAVARLRQASPSAPVFTLLTPYDTHYPHLPMPEYDGNARCANMPPWLPANYNEADVSDKPAYISNRGLLPETDGWPMVDMCEEMLGLDWMVGQVRAELQAQGRLDNTLFIFSADNGMGWGQHRVGNEKQVPFASPVPLYMSFPARWGSNPRTFRDAVSNIDLAPTFCDLAGNACTLGPYPTGQSGPDGISLLPLLDGDVSELPRDAVLETVYQKRLFSAIRTSPSNPLGFWHYVELETGERELYDLSGGPCSAWSVGMAGDPCEMSNRATDPSLANLRASLSARLQGLLAEGRVESSPLRPDGSVAIAAIGTFKGANVYAIIPKASQTQTLKLVLKHSVNDFVVRVTNHGASPASYVVGATSSGSAKMAVSYLVGGVNVTAAVNSGTYSMTGVNPGSSVEMVVRFTVGNAPLSAKKATVLTVGLPGHATQIDVLKMVAIRSTPPPPPPPPIVIDLSPR